ncbi:MAG: UDP-N-acetylglucosamine--N-acetylmuramyl-(pentapeptide) pyrophosphoryl-undecaprenol N-acetylglucosamine transferase [Acidimicrobiia bacterium]|nr:UDP-N-acetylglucosamine--N-acetylmuramyl-(pentapeptide) pyrophosphoryl-undecaprenol N-acetylglucosamine transferase [bacterium]MXX01815.1 UDP-N-acetylglucosamine--N-acetylmuramyl-(pentapeptide) pyrophosphoryl-undecaprenol N-acetylglucosamine transferase [Acidimicrobiia bacterium]MYB79025.1 UDP-N-acetylglucosamine--N-acetylmuramyl-(pentapeptide) pyrophosphoryl-undecaprenol N-acetylglucosamine transferase [Acidimicrobiia bacterium]MYD41161.1 UDP-N-acetylglucosamine--N-acetylmuramyl-(pentapeptid
MTFAIAAAGTAGHVYPGLAVAEALVAQGVDPSDVLFIGGDRLEATAVPAAGFRLLSVPLQGLSRRLTARNLTIPAKLARAVRRVRRELANRAVGVLLATGGYVAAPAGWAARSEGIPFYLSEQNAVAGLANRVMERWAVRSFASFSRTSGLKKADWVGNPVRADLARLDRLSLRKEAFCRYDLVDGLPVVGVMGGSLGAAAINRGVAEMLGEWKGDPVQVVHLAGEIHTDEMTRAAEDADHRWRVVGFERRMDFFYSACDVVVARAGGGVAELIIAGLPSVLVPGEFGSAGHQAANAAALEDVGAAVIVPEPRLGELGSVLADLLADPDRRTRMSEAAAGIARPRAAETIAEELRRCLV